MHEKLGKPYTPAKQWHAKPYFIGLCILGLLGSVYLYRYYFSTAQQHH